MKNPSYFIIILIIIFLGIFIYFIFEPEEPSYPHLKNIDYNYIENQMRCFTHRGNERKEFIINSQEELQVYGEGKFSTPFCEDSQLPNIDFNTKTLLGKTTDRCGCSSTSSRSVYIDDKEKEIIYSIVITSEGSCEIAGTEGNWVLIDKVPIDYKVRFETKYMGNNCQDW